MNYKNIVTIELPMDDPILKNYYDKFNIIEPIEIVVRTSKFNKEFIENRKQKVQREIVERILGENSVWGYYKNYNKEEWVESTPKMVQQGLVCEFSFGSVCSKKRK
jgi:hypothetical protein